MWSLSSLVQPVLICDVIFGKKIRLQYKRNFPSVCLAWVVFSDHFITKSSYYQTKTLAGLVICVLVTSLFSFSRVVNFIFFTYLFFIAQ